MVSIADRGIVAIIITERRIDDRPLKYVAQYPGISLLEQAILVRKIPSHIKRTAMNIVTTLNTVRGYHFRIHAMINCQTAPTNEGIL